MVYGRASGNERNAVQPGNGTVASSRFLITVPRRLEIPHAIPWLPPPIAPQLPFQVWRNTQNTIGGVEGGEGAAPKLAVPVVGVVVGEVEVG